MKKEDLLALGLTEEQANTVIDGFGKMIPKSRLDEKIAEVNQLKSQIDEYNGQLEELKKVDAAALQQEIEKLQAENAETQANYQKQLQETQLNSALTLALHGKVHDTDVAIGLINKEAIELADGKITKGLDEQLSQLRESKSYLFVPEQTPQQQKPTVIAGAKPHDKGGAFQAEPISEGASFAQMANAKTATVVTDPWGQ